VVRAIEHRLEVIDRSLPVLRIGRDRVVRLVRQHRHRRALEAVVLDDLPHFREVLGIAHIEYRDLHAVITHRLELRKEMKVVFRDVTGPKQQVKSNFHVGAMLGTLNVVRNTAVAENPPAIRPTEKDCIITHF
jgi:hypothetical protein